MSRGAARPRRRGAGARPPRRVRTRLRRRLPSAGRVLAVLLFATLVGGLVTLVNGPWLRVATVASAGARFTPAAQLDALLSGYRGAPLLAIDSRRLADRLRELPAVADARVSVQLPNRLSVSITEKPAALSWWSAEQRLVMAADGSVIARLEPDTEVSAEVAALPAVDDQRSSTRRLRVGDRLPPAELRTAERLLALDPALLGSTASGLTLRVDDEHGFLLVSSHPAWQIALGFYQLDPGEGEAAAVARLDAQVAAVRTLFASRPEAGIGWVDARNPGKVYWAP